MEVTYQASPTMEKFHQCDDFVRALIGPIGSGKSVACCAEMMRRSMEQEADREGFRKTRWAVIRNTYRELIDTTMQTFFDWFPRELGLWRAMDMKWTLVKDLGDGTTLHMEVLFRALDKPDDVKKLLSLEITAAWGNEAREIPKAVIDMLQGRVGRYPAKKNGCGATWFGIIADTNPPDSDHWWYKLFEEDCPDEFSIFHQPSGLSEEAENIENLPDGYYTKMMSGKDKEWINVYVHGLYGFVQDGKPVFPEYKDDIHSTLDEIELVDTTIYVGIDFGLTPAAVLGQKTSGGRWLIIDELVTEDMGAKNFATLLAEKFNRDYHGRDLQIYGDPAGDQRAQTDEITPFQILAAAGIIAYPTYTNDPIIRREACAAPMQRLDFAGNTGLILGPKAKILRKGLAGGYKYKRMAVGGAARYMDKPDKGRYSHVCDAFQYLMVGAGEGLAVIGTGDFNKPLDYSHSDRQIV